MEKMKIEASDTEGEYIEKRAKNIMKDISPDLISRGVLVEAIASLMGDIKDSNSYDEDLKNTLDNLSIEYLKKPNLSYEDVTTFIEYATSLIKK